METTPTNPACPPGTEAPCMGCHETLRCMPEKNDTCKRCAFPEPAKPVRRDVERVIVQSPPDCA